MGLAGTDCDTVICGAGIAGIATAYYLSCHFGQKDIVLVDRGQPMAYTSSKSGENYRDYWPQACMSAFVGRSIDLMTRLHEQSDHAFGMRDSGYDFVSLQKEREIFPSGHLRDSEKAPELETVNGSESLRSRYPYLSDSVQQVVRIQKAGSIDVHAMGSLMLSKAKQAGVRFNSGHVEAIHPGKGRFRLDTRQGDSIQARRLVLAAGPMNQELAAKLDVDLNLSSYLQRKFVIPDPEKVIPRDMPFTIFADPQTLDWSHEERQLIASDPEYRWLLEEFPAGLHVKPESAGQIKLGWAFNRTPEKPRWQPGDDFDFPNIVLRGASRFIPGLARYIDQVPTPVYQFCGYYTRTPENWPLIGPLETHPGLYTVAALSGFGTMAACAAGELLAGWMTGRTLPTYARHFHPDRYRDPEIRAQIDAIESDGQL